MATKYGVQKTVALANSALVEQGYAGGRVRCISDKYTVTADLAANDTIEMGSKLPKGARIVDARLIHPAMGGGTFDVGWKASDDGAETAVADGIIDGTDVTNAGSVSAAATHYTEAFLNKVFAAEVQPVIKVATDTSATSGDIYLDIFYVVD